MVDTTKLYTNDDIKDTIQSLEKLGGVINCEVAAMLKQLLAERYLYQQHQTQSVYLHGRI